MSSETVEVIGAGLGRTGTSSLKKALEILGYDPTYHMVENFKQGDSKFWIRVYEGKDYDFDEIFNRPGTKYRATTDWPASGKWEEQLKKYPNAKVILTTRDPEKWYYSCCETIFVFCPHFPSHPFGISVTNFLGIPAKGFPTLMEHMFVFYKDFSKENVNKFFMAHNENVMKKCPPEQLLVFDVKQGWEPLCSFLNKPIPNTPFPYENETAEFKRIINVSNILGYSIFISALMLPIGIVGASLYYYHKK